MCSLTDCPARMLSKQTEQVSRVPSSAQAVFVSRSSSSVRVRVQLIGHLQPCMTDIYLHIVARMADYMATHPYIGFLASGRHACTRTNYIYAAVMLAGQSIMPRGNLANAGCPPLPPLFAPAKPKAPSRRRAAKRSEFGHARIRYVGKYQSCMV